MFLLSKGQLTLKFQDGSLFDIGLSENKVTNVFWGDMRHELLNTQTFVDTKNNLRATIQYGPSERVGVPSDYFEGCLEKFDPAQPDKEGQVLSNITGSWVGFCDFDKVRYWDINSCSKLSMSAPVTLLKSDSRNRPDRIALAAKDITLAQAEKIRLEETQRRERKLREAKHGVKGH